MSFLNIDLGVEALSPHLTGIGRYTHELHMGLQSHQDVRSLRPFYQSEAIPDVSVLLNGTYRPPGKFVRRIKRAFDRLESMAPQVKRLYHGPNFMLPPMIESGVITVHDLSVMKFPETHPPARVAHFERDFANSIQLARHVITDTEQVRQELIAYAGLEPNRVTAIHLGVSSTYNPDRKRDAQSILGKWGITSGKYILLVATFEPRKRIDAALRAYQCLPDRTKRRYPLVLVGASGWQNEALHQMIADEQQKGFVRTLGFVPETHLPILYSAARLFLYPSIYEGFGLPPLEALASGVPTIVSDASCLPEVTQGAAMMINPDDYEGFAQSILKGLEDDEWRSSAIIHGLTVAAGYTWKNCIDATVGVYGSVWNEL